jgi:aubergine-like protein
MSDPRGSGNSQDQRATTQSNEAAGGGGPMGRGRGRGTLPENRIIDSDSESAASGKRSQTETRPPESSKRGRHREDKTLPEVHYTKPENLLTKEGTSGKPIFVLTNHFKIRFNPKLKFRLYRIDFAPDCDDLRLRKALIFQHQEMLGAYIFDGQNLIYLTRPPANLEPVSRSREGVDYKLILKDTNQEINFTNSMGLMVLNTILRRAMDQLKLQVISENLMKSFEI